MNRSIVITAVSPITPLGADMDTIAQKLEEGVCGLQYVKRFNTKYFDVKHAGEINFSELDTIDYPIEGNVQFKMFYYCMKKMFDNMKPRYRSDRIGCIIGADPNIGTKKEFENLFMKYHEKCELVEGGCSNDIMMIDPMMLSYYAAKEFGVNGPFVCNLGTCAASTQAIGTGYYMLQDGVVDLMIVGGVSSKIDPISFSRLSRLGALESTKENLEENCCPFDKRRSGFTMSEGCVLLALEREEDAIKRNATILGKIQGYGAALDGFSMTNPHEDALGMRLAMERALQDAQVSASQVDYINAHGTGTVVNDSYETKAIKDVFQNDAYRVSINSTKSMHGHLMTATGAMEVLCCLIAMRDSKIAPTIHYVEPDPECDLDYIVNEAKQKKVNIALSNTFGLGGQNASLIISKYENSL